MSDPALHPTIRLAAARALLERLREKTALTRWWRHNASAKHGVPLDEPPLPELVVVSSVTPAQDQQIDIPSPEETPTRTYEDGDQATTSPAAASQPAASAGVTAPHSRWRDALLALLAASGLIGGGIATGYWLSPTTIVQGTEGGKETDPYVWIQNRGEHLP